MAAAPKKAKPAEDLDTLEPMLTRLKLTAIRDQLNTLQDQAPVPSSTCAQPSVDSKQIRELAVSRGVAHGDNVQLLRPPGR